MGSAEAASAPSRSRPASVGQVIGWSACAAAAAYIVTVGGGYPGIGSIQTVVLLQAFAVVILTGWLLIALWKPAWRPTSPLLLPILIACAAYALSSWLSQRPRLSLKLTIGGLGFALAYLFLARALREPWFRRRAGALFIVVVGVTAVAYVAEVVVLWWVGWWQLIGTVDIPPLRPYWAGLLLGTPNLVSAFLIIAGPLAILLLRERVRRRAWVATFAALIVLALFLTGSRSAYLAAVVVLAATVLIGGQASTRWLRTKRARGVAPTFRVLLSLPALAAAALIALLPAIAHRLDQGGDDLRIALWRSALDVFATYPITGGGPGTWPLLKIAEVLPETPDHLFAHAHNMYAQLLAELGLVGFLALALVFLATVRLFRRAIRHSDGVVRMTALGATCGLAGFGSLAIFDTLTNTPVACLLVVCLVAWVDSSLPAAGGYARLHGWRRLERSRLLPAVGLLAIAATVPTLLRINSAWIQFLRGNEAAYAGDWNVALASYENARRMDPDFTLYTLQSASALAR